MFIVVGTLLCVANGQIVYLIASYTTVDYYTLVTHALYATCLHKAQHCRVCGQRLTKVKTKSIAYQCKVIAEKLQTAFGIDTSGDDLHIHPESMCKC